MRRSLRQLSRDDVAVAAVLVAVAVLAVALRAPGALSLPFWQDEVASARVITQPTLPDVVAQVRRTESTPPAWYALAWAGHRAGISLEGLRLLSVVFSTALAVLVVVYARRLLPLWTASAAGLLVGVGWQFVAHGRELRAYALYALLSLAFAFALAAAARAPTRRRLFALGACVAAGLLTHYLFALTLLAGLVWLTTAGTARGARARATLAACLGAVPLLAVVPLLSEQYTAERFGWISDFDPLKASYFYGTLFDWGGSLYADDSAPFGVRQVLWLAALGAVLAGCTVLWRRSDEGRLAALLAVAPVLGAAVVWLAGPDIFNTRNLLGAGPFAAVAVAAALAALPRRAALGAAATALGLAVAGTAQGPPLGPPADRVAQALIAQGWRQDDPIILFGDFYGFRSTVGWYLPGRPFLELSAAEAADGRLYLIAQGDGTWAALTGYYHLDALSVRRVEDVYVARLPSDERLAQGLAAIGGYVLAAPPGPAA